MLLSSLSITTFQVLTEQVFDAVSTQPTTRFQSTLNLSVMIMNDDIDIVPQSRCIIYSGLFTVLLQVCSVEMFSKSVTELALISLTKSKFIG